MVFPLEIGYSLLLEMAHLQLMYLLKMVIFHSHASLPEGIYWDHIIGKCHRLVGTAVYLPEGQTQLWCLPATAHTPERGAFEKKSEALQLP